MRRGQCYSPSIICLGNEKETMSNRHNGQIVILNGAPRSGKSSIVEVIQRNFQGVWINLGVDVYLRKMTPEKYWPGIGLRPGGERPDIEPLLPVFYAALYESIAAHSRLGLNVVTDVGHHDSYSKPLNILADCAERLLGLPVLFVGIRCPINVVMERRKQEQSGREGDYISVSAHEAAPLPVLAWQREVHIPGEYDLELDTSVLTPEECAEIVHRKLLEGNIAQNAFEKLRKNSVKPLQF
jgi:chloramphenicol 3-O phosphotransferase